MLKKILTGTGIAAILTAMFFLGSLTLGSVFAHTQDNTSPVQAFVQGADDDADETAVEGPDLDDIELEEQVGEQSELDDDTAEATVEDLDIDDVEEQQPQYTGSILVDDAQYEGMSEAEDAAAFQRFAKVTANEAEAAAIAANLGATVVETELDNENGVLVYSVELSNGNDVKVDAGNGQILHTESDDVDDEDESGEQETDED